MNRKLLAMAGMAAAAFALPTSLAAQDAQSGSDLLALGDGELDDALETRYDAGLAASTNDAIVNGNDPRYLWALETKVQCGIAIGYRKSSTRDEPSIRKCALAYAMLNRQPRVMTPPVRPEPPAICNARVAGTVYFEFDSAAVPASTSELLDELTTTTATCSWKSFVVVGHTDRSGSNAYNDALALRRAEAIAQLMRGRGIGESVLAVSGRGEEDPAVDTADGVREERNRRVEITVQR